MIDQVSPFSIVKYDKLKPKLPELICPCAIPLTQELKVTDDFGSLLVLVQYIDNPLKLSVILKKDLRKINYDKITEINS